MVLTLLVAFNLVKLHHIGLACISVQLSIKFIAGNHCVLTYKQIMTKLLCNCDEWKFHESDERTSLL